MRKIVLFVIGLMMLFFYSNQAGAKEYDKSKLFSLWVDMGLTIPSNDELERATGGGKTSFNFRFEYCFARSYLSPSLGLQVGKLPLDQQIGLENRVLIDYWNWTDGIIYMKVEMDRGLLTPYVRAGFGLYDLNLKIPIYTGINDPNFNYISKSYLGYDMGFGFELIFKKLPVSLFTELEYSIIPISPAIQLSKDREVKSARILNPKFGFGF